MSINVNCCEGLNFQKILCNCNWGSKKPTESKEQVVYTDRHEQIVILSTPHIEVPDLVLYDDIQNTDVAIFTLDSNSDVRFTSLQGRNIFQSIDLQPPPPPSHVTPRMATLSLSHSEDGPAGPHSARERASSALATATSGAPEHKSHPSIALPEDVAGRTLKDILPEYMLRFLLPICKQTLQGNFLQLTIMWGGLTQLVRTYPIPDPKRRIIAGMLTISPFVNAFNVDVNRFSLGNIGDPTHTVTLTPNDTTSLPHINSTGTALLPTPQKRTSKPEIMKMQ